MTAYSVITCNGTRRGQPCLGAITIPAAVPSPEEALAHARATGWTLGTLDLCPSPGHDQEPASE